MEWKEQFLQQIKRYKKSCKVIKQINSNKAKFYQDWSNRMNVITISSSVFLTAIAFMDKKLINQIFFNSCSGDTRVFDFIFNIAVLLVLLLSIINLIYRFQDKSYEHYRAVIILSALSRDIDDLENFDNYDQEKAGMLLSEVRNKYKSILDLLPQNTDDEFIQAKADIADKEKRENKIEQGT